MTNQNDAERIFAQALRDDSNLELDWLWAATQMDTPARRRACLERALAIDPASERARQGLARVGAQSGQRVYA